MATRQPRKDPNLDAILAAIQANEKPPESSLSKNIVSIGVSIITAVILFCATFVYQSNAKITEMGITLKYVSDSVADLKRKSDDAQNQFVTRQEFEKARTERQTLFSDFESRLRYMESKRK